MSSVCLLTRRSSLFRARRFALLVAPLGVHEFAIVTVSHVIAREVVPEISGRRIVDVGLIVFEGIFVSILALKIVCALFAAVGDLPGSFFVVVGSDAKAVDQRWPSPETSPLS